MSKVQDPNWGRLEQQLKPFSFPDFLKQKGFEKKDTMEYDEYKKDNALFTVWLNEEYCFDFSKGLIKCRKVLQPSSLHEAEILFKLLNIK